jgi:outer membrane receptor protein involved in Fe transport
MLFAQAITGTVFDAQTGRPIPNVKIAVNGQTDQKQQTGTDGRFTIPISPGTYTLRFTADNYNEVAVNEVIVGQGETVDASTVMSSRQAVTTVDVVERIGAVSTSAEAALSERRLAPSVSDSLSREELSAAATSDAANALEKVTGVSIVGEGFVFVRGLGERYSATMLNSAMIPTTEPERRVVPLDLFPSTLIESIKVLKTYTPDLPAEFSGGLVQLQTIEFPVSKVFRTEISTAYNARTSFQRFLSYPGGSRDFFGFDDGTRSIPGNVPAERRLFQGTFSPAELQQFGQSFAPVWEPATMESMRPATTFNMAGGGTFGKFGVVGALTFTNRPQVQSELQRYLRQGGNGPIIFTEYDDFRSYNENARLGGVFNVAYRMSPLNKIVWRNTLTHDTDKETREFAGYDGGADTFLSSQRLRWVERSLLSTSLDGEHAISNWRNTLLHWQMTYSRSSRNEPDLREVFRGQTGDGRFIFASFGSSGLRFFSDLKDEIFEPQADISQPFFKGPISGLWKVGFRGTFRDRSFQARRFRYIPMQQSTLDLYAPSNQLFAPSNIRPNGFQIVEFTRATDRYTAGMDVYAGYAMLDLGIGSRLRVIGGVRIEDSDIRVKTLDPLVPNAIEQMAFLKNTDPAPGVNVIYSLTPRQNLRGGVSRTLSRPDFRELSPFDFNNVLGGFVAQGNPNLLRATIDNYDVRWEYFMGGNQLLAASLFIKKFTDPIEQTILPANDLRQTFVNANGARNTGFELEARQGLGRFGRYLRNVSVQGNFTFVDSNIRIRESDALLLTSKDRPLLGQSRYIVNASRSGFSRHGIRRCGCMRTPFRGGSQT